MWRHLGKLHLGHKSSLSASFTSIPYSNYTSYAYYNQVNQYQGGGYNPTYQDNQTVKRSPKPILQFNTDFCRRLDEELARERDSSRIRWQTFPRLAQLIKSFREGELTVFTGPTGSGKTTVLSQLSLDYCFQGVRTLWGSFEIKNTRLGRIMLQQVSSTGESADFEEDYHSAKQTLQQLPLYFMDYFGSTPLEQVLECMSQAVKEHQIQHIILDNLQFMLSGQHSSALDRFDLTDRSVAALRAFATTKNVHVTLVIHPRKEQDDTPLGLASVSGTAKATQEADNVIILQKVGESRYLDVKKNRFDGELGTVSIKYDSRTRLTYESWAYWKERCE